MWKLKSLFAGKSLNCFRDDFLSLVSSVILELLFGYWTFCTGLLIQFYLFFLLFFIFLFKLFFKIDVVNFTFFFNIVFLMTIIFVFNLLLLNLWG